MSTGPATATPSRARRRGRRPERSICVERYIAAARDGARWVFETDGTPFPFEDLTAYRRRITSHRFTREMLHEYLRRLGIPVDSEIDWRRAVLLELTS